jgi:HK97 family phage prohead protease
MDTTRVSFPIEWRALDTDQRIVGGIAVPWNETSYMTGDPKGERFLPGALTRSVKARGSLLKLFRGGGNGHDLSRPIGRPVNLDARHPDGFYTQWRIANTPDGDAALREIGEGMLDSFSIGFRALKSQRGQDGAREVVEADVAEVQLLPIGAYAGARVLEVRAPVTGAAEIQAWLDAHPAPVVNVTPVVLDFRRKA